MSEVTSARPSPLGDFLPAQAREQQIDAWLAGDPDPATRQELRDLVAAGDQHELADRFARDLAFGTAGLRGVVGAGPNRMNRAVVIRTTRGLADHLLARGLGGRGVVVGFDARHDSARFAEDAVAVLAAAGIVVHRFPSPQPTPLIAYAQKALRAAAAVVVTASHNPAEYNGYKVYAEGAAQIVPPTDREIAAAIADVGPATDVPRVAIEDSPLVRPVEEVVVDQYLDELRAALPAVDGPPLVVAYTPLHGVGGDLVARAFLEAGATELHMVAAQVEPDGDFPTVGFPNPEEPGAMDAVLRLAEDVGADLVLANDPDADRLAVAVPGASGGYQLLSGNQIGVLLADHLLEASDAHRPLVVSSVVSTPMIHAVAAAHGARSEVALTGFKWICAAARELERDDARTFVFGFEEALGSTVGSVVHDKDGIGAAVAFAGLVRGLAADGLSVMDRWAALCRRHGLWISHQHAVTLPGIEGAARIAAAMERLTHHIPTRLAGHDVRDRIDYRVGAQDRPPWLGAADLVELSLADGRVLIRPSGTEPKCKIYVDLRAATIASGGDLDRLTEGRQAEARSLAVALAREVGLE